MSTRPLRFVHTSDLHLEAPPSGLAEVPEHLRELAVECGYWSAERVFAVVLAEEAEFLLLSGDILQPEETGPRGPLFLAEQFERLAEREIQVYWAGGQADPPEVWPACVRLPKNVHVFPTHRIDRFLHQREGQPVASIVGTSRKHGQAVPWGEFSIAPDGLFTVAVVHGEAEAEVLRSRNIDYWALGGDHARKTLYGDLQAAHYPGTPQGREPSQIGPHGCTLVQVDVERHVRTNFVAADVLRWHNERIVLDPAMSRKDLQSRLNDRIDALKQSNPGVDLFVSWTIVGEGTLATHLRRGSLAAALLETMRSEHGFGSPAVWSVGLDVEPPAVLPASWYEQQTILGDFLRELRRHLSDDEGPISLETYLGETHRTGPLAAAATIAPGAARERIVREAAMLGCDLLTGDGPGSTLETCTTSRREPLRGEDPTP
jgi:DNA repair protein SbcD/Mre11